MRRSVWLFVMGSSLACGGDDGGASVQPAAAFGRCEVDTDCAEGLFCALGGPLVGHCAFACAKDDECQARYGESHACADAVCVQICGWLADSCVDPVSSDFETCGDGLSCRAENDRRCASLCATESWGEVSRDEGFHDFWSSESEAGDGAYVPEDGSSDE